MIKQNIGWKEWCQLPELNIPVIKAKIDTGARTSALHASHIIPFQKNGDTYVRFRVYPIQNTRKIMRTCEAKVIDYRTVKNSGGQTENRYVIQTPIILGKKTWLIDITLTNRSLLRFRMLIGRQAIKTGFLLDPGKVYQQKKYSKKTALCYYNAP